MFKSFFKRKSGSIAPIFGICAVALIATAGVALDYSNAVRVQTKLQDSADAAALAASRRLSTGASWNDARRYGEELFAANMEGFGIENAQVELRLVDRRNNAVRANGQANSPNTMTTLLPGVGDQMEIAATSVAQRTPTPLEIIFLVDVSYSMGIGASPNDIGRFYKATGCAFACHDSGTDVKARLLRVKTRLDIIKEAMTETLIDVQKKRSSIRPINIGYITFSNTMIDATPPTRNFNFLRQRIKKIYFPKGRYQAGTNYSKAISEAVRMIKFRKAGNANVQDNTQYAVVLLTDGVQSNRMIVNHKDVIDYSVKVVQPSITSLAGDQFMAAPKNMCDPVKKEGATMFVLNTEYVTQNVNGFSISRMKKSVLPIVPERLQACASSPAFFKTAEHGDAVKQATKLLTNLAIENGTRLAM